MKLINLFFSFKNEEKLNRLYRLNEKHGSGIVGPYGLSNDQLNRGEKSNFNPGVLIVNSALGEISGPIISGLGKWALSICLSTFNSLLFIIDTPTTEKNKVRFIDDGTNNGGDRRINQYNKNLILPKSDVTANDEISETIPASDLKGLKDLVNQFIPRTVIRTSSQNNNNNQLPILPNLNSLSQQQNYDSYTESDSEKMNRFTGTYNLPSIVTNQNNRNNEVVYSGPVYSITNSFRQQFNNDNNNNIQPQQTSASIENIYSKVLTVGKPKKQNQPQEQNYDNDEQPLYMNTDSYEYQAPNQQQNQNFKSIPPTYGSWNDSSV